MAKVPMMIMVDPDVETQFTIKPFAAGLATRAPDDPSELERRARTQVFTMAVGSVDVSLDVAMA